MKLLDGGRRPYSRQGEGGGGGAYTGGSSKGLVRRGAGVHEGVGEGQASIPGLACGGRKGGGGEVTRGCLGARHGWVGFMARSSHELEWEIVPSGGEGGGVLPFRNNKFQKGDHITS